MWETSKVGWTRTGEGEKENVSANLTRHHIVSILADSLWHLFADSWHSLSSCRAPLQHEAAVRLVLLMLNSAAMQLGP